MAKVTRPQTYLGLEVVLMVGFMSGFASSFCLGGRYYKVFVGARGNTKVACVMSPSGKMVTNLTSCEPGVWVGTGRVVPSVQAAAIASLV